MPSTTTIPSAEPNRPAPAPFWPNGWWKIVDARIGIVPLPIFLVLLALIAGFAATGSVPSDILMAIVLLSMGGFACAELGKRIPIIRNIGAAAIFATFIPSFLAFHHLLPQSVLNSITQFTKDSNFLYLFISCIIVGSILGMDRGVLIKGFLKIFLPIDTAIVTACHSGQGGTGDVAILTAANRMQLMPFAQIATRIGGAITVTLVLIGLTQIA
jgi:Na+/citrate or Na+/malate symporter